MIPASSVDLAGRRVLVVEDEFLIALDIEQMLRRLGAGPVDVAAHLADAFAAIGRTLPDLAVLDFKLGMETTVSLAETLAAHAVPLVFLTGYDDLGTMPGPLRDAPRLGKPVDFSALAATLGRLPYRAAS